MPLPNSSQALLEAAGGSKTVYALYLPETKEILDTLLDGRDAYHDMYTKAWTHKQDSAHQLFFDTWKAWVAPIVDVNWDVFPFYYPTAGASEAIRESISAYGHRARHNQFSPLIHVFEGEYEGYQAYAEAAQIPVMRHDRSQWTRAIDGIGPNDQFYISQPSGIDGMVWKDYDAFLGRLNEAQPEAQVMVDLTYVGCVGKKFNVSARHPNIRTAFFSLSKPFGVYYHRIGGMLSHEEHKGLYGNMWFKNLLSLKLGAELMKKYGVHELPAKYAALTQGPAASEIGTQLGLSLSPCDVYLLASAQASHTPTDLERLLLRGSGDEARVRVCLTPTMAQFLSRNAP